MANAPRVEDDSGHVKTSEPKPAADSSSSAAGAGAVAACSIPSFAAASELLSAPYSCLVMTAHRRHLSLPPVFLHKKRTGIQEELQAELLRFSHSLKGVPLAYDDIRIVGRHGDIYDDSGYVHMDIMANFIVFQPQKGQKLLGRVNKLAASHVGCLVHGCFNASIPKPNRVPMETWRDAGPQIGAELEFEVSALDSDNVGVLLIRGQLQRTRVQELLAMSENAESTVHQGAATETPSDPGDSPEPATEDAVDSGKKKKKKRKRDTIKEEEEEEEEEEQQEQEEATVTAAELNGTSGHVNGNDDPGEDGRKKKKKKKKKRESEVKEEEVHVFAAERQGSDSSGYNSDKPAKKRRRDSDAAGEESPPSAKKRTPSGMEQLA